MKFVEVINAFNVSAIEHLKKNKKQSGENAILVLTSLSKNGIILNKSSSSKGSNTINYNTTEQIAAALLKTLTDHFYHPQLNLL